MPGRTDLKSTWLFLTMSQVTICVAQQGPCPLSWRGSGHLSQPEARILRAHWTGTIQTATQKTGSGEPIQTTDSWRNHAVHCVPRHALPLPSDPPVSAFSREQSTALRWRRPLPKGLDIVRALLSSTDLILTVTADATFPAREQAWDVLLANGTLGSFLGTFWENRLILWRRFVIVYEKYTASPLSLKHFKQSVISTWVRQICEFSPTATFKCSAIHWLYYMKSQHLAFMQYFFVFPDIAH